MAAKKAKTDQLQAIEENTSRLCTGRQQLQQWLEQHEGKAAQVRDDLQPGDVIVATDPLAAQALHAQVCTIVSVVQACSM